MKFNLSDYPDTKVVMHVETEEQDLIFRTFLDAQGRTWCGRISYLVKSAFYVYESQTCYAFNIGKYCNCAFYITCGYTILNFSDFDWSDPTLPEETKPIKLRFTW